ncbi:MAG: TetR/AcrR family transcriptional regulator [Treponema sp.]|nr:TetR/AcrR family transcriptional regulator [Treponema sp.]
MRIVKDAEERKNEILDAAEKLFSSNGFESTSMNDIQNEIGIARGTLYYHFKSKEEMLDAIIERIIGRMTENAKEIAADKSIPVLQRLVKTILSLNIKDHTVNFLMEQMHKPENALMHQKIQEKTEKKINPVIADIVKDGIEQKIFNTDYPDEAVEMVMLYSNLAFHDASETDDSQKQRKILGFIYNLERIFGAEKGYLLEALMPLFK